MFVVRSIRSGLGLIFVGVLVLVSPAASAQTEQITALKDAARKVNLSGRQRMLTQFMAKSACFASINVRFDHHRQKAGFSHYLFAETLGGLRNGSAVQGMLPETHADVLKGLDKVEAHWSRFGAAVEVWLKATGDFQKALDDVFELNVPTLKAMNETVKLIETAYSQGGAMSPGLALAINVAGRQRMLSQKASKEFCLIARGDSSKAARMALQGTIELFSKSLERLKVGDADGTMPSAPSAAIKSQLDVVSSKWLPFKAILQSVADGAPVSEADIAFIADNNEDLLGAMNKAVFLYEEVS
ncbi:MAG: type IV pili methyl-accepting chemotaxis transducer N-terminal domain-containing protein [Pseudomonadota bacterium]